MGSLAGLLRLDPDELAQRLCEFDYSGLSPQERSGVPFQNLLLEHALMTRKENLPIPSEFFWFHGTRVPKGTTFAEGILPLPEAVEKIWDLLWNIVKPRHSPDEWAWFRKNMAGQGAEQYSRKLAFDFSHGPFAILVREVLLKPSETDSHDYLGVPEIVEDICMSYLETFGINLYDEFVSATQPCIIKFVSRNDDQDAVAAAVTYVHRRLRREDLLPTECSTCFNGGARRISPEAIVRIDWPEVPAFRREMQ